MDKREHKVLVEHARTHPEDTVDVIAAALVTIGALVRKVIELAEHHDDADLGSVVENSVTFTIMYQCWKRGESVAALKERAVADQAVVEFLDQVGIAAEAGE